MANEKIFSPEYSPGSDTKFVSETKKTVEDTPIKIESRKYGISKPIRHIIKGKITND